MADAFSGFPAAALDFYEDLEDDNSRTFWLAHKQVYADAVLAPLQAFAAEVEPEFGPAKIFRPYRDVRFAKDKTPYKTQQGVWFEESSRYLQLDAAGLLIAGGRYHFSPDQLARYRRAIDADIPAGLLDGAIAGCVKAGLAVGGDKLTRIPTGFAKDHPRPDLLRHKSLTVSARVDAPAWVFQRRAKTEIVRRWRTMTPLVAWLDHHVGEAEADR